MKRYLGLDTSSKAIHGVVVNKKEELISLHKWGSNLKGSSERFPEIITGFSDELSKINITDKSEWESD